MGKRKEERPAEAGGVDPALAAFATFIRSEEEQERSERRARKQARAAEQEANRLVEAKDAAAAELKRLKARSGVAPEERAAAEDAYRRALAAVVAAETGEAPEWAPAEEQPTEEQPTEDGSGAEATSEGAEAVADEPDSEPDSDSAEGEASDQGADA